MGGNGQVGGIVTSFLHQHIHFNWPVVTTADDLQSKLGILTSVLYQQLSSEQLMLVH